MILSGPVLKLLKVYIVRKFYCIEQVHLYLIFFCI